MPVATPAQYAAMLDAAQKGGYAYPAINVTSLPTINGALKAFAESKSDGIIQVSTGGGEFASGTAVKDMALGAIVLAEAVQSLWPGTQVTIGPVIDTGFFYDFARNEPFTPEELAEMADGMGDALSSLSGESTIAYISPRALVLDEVEASISCWR